MKVDYSVSLTYALGAVGAIVIGLMTIAPDSALANVGGWLRLLGLPGFGWPAAAAGVALLALNSTVIWLFMLWLRPRLYAEAQAELWAAMQRNITEPRPAPGHP